MRRLLMYFSYIGTNYRGLQRKSGSSSGSKTGPDFETIQGILEFGLKKILWLDRVSFFTSSRTDTKVHAHESTAIFELNPADLKKKPYSPEIICQSLNLFLDKNECDIKVKRIVEVPVDFNCRRAHSREYIFRVAVFNAASHNVNSSIRLNCALRLTDHNRCEAISTPFDVQAVQDACKLFIGEWNFSTFMKSSREIIPNDKRIKTIRRFSFSPEIFPVEEFDDILPELENQPYTVYTFTVEGSGFLRRQVRRMVGALVSVGRGVIKPEDIIWMLNNPSEKNWNSKATVMGPNGLFLKHVNYSNVPVLRGYLS